MLEIILGLDIGIASIGWAVIAYDKEDVTKNKIIKSGVRIFTQAEHPKDGSSLAMPRRLARGARRTLKRKRQRMKGVKKLFMKYLALSKEDLFIGDEDKTIYGKQGRVDVWELRDEALKRVLTSDELARVLTHIAKRRGYKSNRKVDELGNSEGKKVLSAIEHNKELLVEYKTIGQAMYQSTKDTGVRRNKKDEYLHSVSREMLLDEVNVIFEKQKEFNSPLISETLKDGYIEIAFYQRDFASVTKMVGKCTFEKNELRAAKRTYSAEEFVTLTKLINTKVVLEDGSERGLFKDELEKIILLCKQSEKPSYIKIKETIGLETTSSFKNIEDYEVDKETGEVLTKKPIKFKSAFKGYHSLRKEVTKVLSKTHWHNLSQDRKLLDDIATIFTHHKSDEKIREELDKLHFSMLEDDETMKLKTALISSISFDQFIYLSIKALDKILPYMKEGKRYDEAVALVGYKKVVGTQHKFLRALNKEEQNELTNPVVKRAIAQTRKIVNALIREYGQFDKVHIELTREIKKSHKDRNEIKKGQEKYQKFKEKVVSEFIENFGREPKGAELLKFRLWKEQGGYCAYSGFKGKEAYIQPEKLIADVKYAEIDHILPYSRSLDDGMNNKVLCLAKENQDKKDQTPYEYFESIDRDWYGYEVFVKSMLKGLKKVKRDRLLKKNFDENSENEFRERNIRDTAYMARYIKNFVEENLELTASGKKKVLSVNGALTSMLRHNWGVGNKSRDTHLHHAVDAILIAFATDSEVQRLSTISAKTEGFNYTSSEAKSKKFRFTPPMENFRDDVQKSIDDIFVSNAPRRKVTGAAHKETIYSKDAEKGKGSFEVNGGLAENGEVKRVDVFKKDDKYHFVYLYPADFEKDELPNITIKGIAIDNTFEFQFSIFKDELIEIKQRSKDAFRGYFKFPESDGRFNIQFHTDSQYDKKTGRFSTGSLEYIKKYQVDVLGNIQEVKKETRVSTKKILRKNKIRAIKKRSE